MDSFCYHAVMERTQISLEPEQMAQLRRLAERRGIPMAALVREAVARLLEEADRRAARQRMLETAGFAADGDGEPVADEHDRYLVEAYDDR